MKVVRALRRRIFRSPICDFDRATDAVLGEKDRSYKSWPGLWTRPSWEFCFRETAPNDIEGHRKRGNGIEYPCHARLPRGTVNDIEFVLADFGL